MTLSLCALVALLTLLAGLLTGALGQVLGSLLMLAGYLALRPPSWWRGERR